MAVGEEAKKWHQAERDEERYDQQAMQGEYGAATLDNEVWGYNISISGGKEGVGNKEGERGKRERSGPDPQT